MVDCIWHYSNNIPIAGWLAAGMLPSLDGINYKVQYLDSPASILELYDKCITVKYKVITTLLGCLSCTIAICPMMCLENIGA